MAVREDDRRLAWTILQDLSARAGIPEWLGSKFDSAAQEVMEDVAMLIAEHRDGPQKGET